MNKTQKFVLSSVMTNLYFMFVSVISYILFGFAGLFLAAIGLLIGAILAYKLKYERLNK